MSEKKPKKNMMDAAQIKKELAISDAEMQRKIAEMSMQQYVIMYDGRPLPLVALALGTTKEAAQAYLANFNQRLIKLTEQQLPEGTKYKIALATLEQIPCVDANPLVSQEESEQPQIIVPKKGGIVVPPKPRI